MYKIYEIYNGAIITSVIFANIRTDDLENADLAITSLI